MTPMPYFGRSWEVNILTQSGTNLTLSNATSESLRVTFSIDTYLLMAYWSATITIYNMDPSTGNQISGIGPASFWKFNQPLRAGDQVTISGGYQMSASGAFSPGTNVLYSGRVLQSIWTRDNVVDWKLTLRCVVGLIENTVNFVSESISGPTGNTDLAAVNLLCGLAGISPLIDAGAQKILSNTTFNRGRALHGRPIDLLKEITGQYQGQIFPWIGPNGLNVRTFDVNAPLAMPSFAYAPPNFTIQQPSGTSAPVLKNTLIGSPQQTQDGVQFRVLMDSTPQIGDVVQIAPGVLVNLFPVQIGSLPPAPNQSGLYVVGGLRHVGDTRGRGEDWYTEITGLTHKFFADFLVYSDQKSAP